MEGEATRQRSVALRGTLDAILNNAARDLRSQADRVDAALAKRIACTDEIRIRLENELKKVNTKPLCYHSIIILFILRYYSNLPMLKVYWTNSDLQFAD